MCEKVVKIWKATKLKVLDKGVCEVSLSRVLTMNQ